MKFLGWMLLLSFSTLHAQEVIENTPLSVEDDGTRKIVEGQKNAEAVSAKDASKEIIKIEAIEVKPESLEAVAAATKKESKKESKVVVKKVTVQPVIVPDQNPQDGQLNLDKRIDDKVVVEVPEKKEAVVESEKVLVLFYDQTLRKYLQFSFGYVNSRYKKIHPTLDNGSTFYSFSFAHDITKYVQSGFSMEILSDNSDQKIPDNIRVVQYRLFANYHAPIMKSDRLDWVGGLALSIGDFGIKRQYLNSQNEEVSVKLKEGTIVGLIPALGVRIYLVGKNSFDIMAEYHHYLGKVQSYIGGLAIAPRFSFEF